MRHIHVIKTFLLYSLFAPTIKPNCCKNKEDLSCQNKNFDVAIQALVEKAYSNVKTDTQTITAELGTVNETVKNVESLHTQISKEVNPLKELLKEGDDYKQDLEKQKEDPTSTTFKIKRELKNHSGWASLEEVFQKKSETKPKILIKLDKLTQDFSKDVKEVEARITEKIKALNKYKNSLISAKNSWDLFKKSYNDRDFYREKHCKPYPGFQKYKNNTYYFVHHSPVVIDLHYQKIQKIAIELMKSEKYHLFSKITLNLYKNYCAKFGPLSKSVEKIDQEFLNWMQNNYQNNDFKVYDLKKKNRDKRERFYLLQARVENSKSNCTKFNYVFGEKNSVDMSVFDGNEVEGLGSLGKGYGFIKNKRNCDIVCLGISDNGKSGSNMKLKVVARNCINPETDERQATRFHGLNAVMPICKMSLPIECDKQ